jgi:hypothetical protein
MFKRKLAVLIAVMFLCGCAGMTWQQTTVTSYEAVGSTLTQAVQSYKTLKAAGMISADQDAQFKSAYGKVYASYQLAGNALSVAVSAADPAAAKTAMDSYQKVMLALPQLAIDLLNLVNSFQK